VLALVGCPREVAIGELTTLAPSDGDADVPDPDAGPARDAGDARVPGRDAAVAACAQRGPLYDVGDGVAGACGSASRGFHYALCVCGGFQNAGDTFIDGFSSAAGASTFDAQSGSLALHGGLALNGGATRQTVIGGSLLIAGDVGAPLAGQDLQVFGSLFDRGQLEGDEITIGGDAQIGGRVRVNRLRVGGVLTLPPGAQPEVRDGAPAFREAPVSVTPPCECARRLDFAALGLDPAESLRALDAPREVTLPCGRYFVERVYANQPLTVRIQGRVALYVRENVVVDEGGSLQIALDAGAELDLVVGTTLSARGPVSIGDPRTPTRTRLYFGGTSSVAGDTLNFEAPSVLGASIYAPTLALNVAGGELALHGAGLVAAVTSQSTLRLHYDRTLARDTCAEASCATQACRAPLRCDARQCLP